MSRHLKSRAAQSRAERMNPPPLTGPVPDEIRPNQELVKARPPNPPFQRLVLTSERTCHECQRAMEKGEVAVVSRRGGQRFRCGACQPSVWHL